MHARVVLGSGTWDGKRCPVLRGVHTAQECPVQRAVHEAMRGGCVVCTAKWPCAPQLF